MDLQKRYEELKKQNLTDGDRIKFIADLGASEEIEYHYKLICKDRDEGTNLNLSGSFYKHDKEGLVELLVDRDLLKDEYLGAHPCHNIATLKVKTKDIFTKFIKATKHYKTEVTLRGQS